MRQHDERRERIIARNKARRRRELRNHMILFSAVTICLVIILSISLGSFFSEAKEKSDDWSKRFKSVMVEYGEDYNAFVARSFDSEHYDSVAEYSAEISRINSIAGDENIAPGQYLVVPYYTTLSN